ncbi:MAG: hypothetical protein JST62_03995 [Bacteroidetes bacterium]|nr:hypothetical protein [Bacteroidota bacterium]
MKKNLLVALFLSLNIFSFGQKKETNIPATYTFEEASKSNDPKVIATFLKSNPNNPRNNELKIKLLKLINPGSIPENSISSKVSTEKNIGKPSKNKKTADILNAILNPDINSKNAVLIIENKSRCAFTLKIIGKNNYSLEVPANGKNYIDVLKGNYSLSATVCTSRYQQERVINTNVTISLTD